MKYVEYNLWNGKIYKVSGAPILDTNSSNGIISIEDDPIINEMCTETRALESGFIGNDNKAYNKDGTIHLPKPRKELSEIPIQKNNNITPDVSLVLYTNNKFMEITINYKAVKTWYNHRMKEKFKFANPEVFTFVITKDDKEIITIEKESKEFLGDFQTTVDLSKIKDLNDIKISTFKMFETYSLLVEKNKYFNLDADNSGFSKMSDTTIKYNVSISLTNKENFISIELIDIDNVTVYKSLDFYITGNDPNELHEIISIPIEKLWDEKFFVKEINCSLENKLIWCNNRTINILMNKKVVKI
jgi:hypothetical protein